MDILSKSLTSPNVSSGETLGDHLRLVLPDQLDAISISTKFILKNYLFQLTQKLFHDFLSISCKLQ